MKRERRESGWRGMKERVRMRGRGLSEDYGSRACGGGETSWGRMAGGGAPVQRKSIHVWCCVRSRTAVNQCYMGKGLLLG